MPGGVWELIIGKATISKRKRLVMHQSSSRHWECFPIGNGGLLQGLHFCQNIRTGVNLTPERATSGVAFEMLVISKKRDSGRQRFYIIASIR